MIYKKVKARTEFTSLVWKDFQVVVNVKFYTGFPDYPTVIEFWK